MKEIVVDHHGRVDQVGGEAETRERYVGLARQDAIHDTTVTIAAGEHDPGYGQSPGEFGQREEQRVLPDFHATRVLWMVRVAAEEYGDYKQRARDPTSSNNALLFINFYYNYNYKN